MRDELQIFSVELLGSPGYSKDPKQDREAEVARLRAQVGALLAEHPGATIEWFQSSAATEYYAVTQLTAIVRWRTE